MRKCRPFSELIAKMSPERRTRVKDEAETLHREYVLSQIRQQVGFTQAEVAERLGISQPTYAVCERGNNMRIGTMQKIASALGGSLTIGIKIKNQNFPLAMKG